MSAFTDRIKNYNASKGTTVPVNPPEAEKVLEEKAAPEVAGVPEPVIRAPEVVDAPSTETAPPAGAVELTKGQKAAATRAANKAKSADGVALGEATRATPEPSASFAQSGSRALDDVEFFVRSLNALGYVVTLTR